MFLPVLVAILTFVSTFCGGLFGLKYKDHLKLILGFTAGVLLAVVAFDIFPEIFRLVGETGISPQIPMVALVAGFLVFHIMEKSLLIHHSHEDEYVSHHHPTVGVFSASALAGHSFLDGLGIGLGFQVSTTVGLVMAIAVIAHDFSDGLNTISLMLVNKNSQKRSYKFYLGFFAGFLLYIGASDILPEAHSDQSSYSTIGLTLFGVIFIYLVTLII